MRFLLRSTFTIPMFYFAYAANLNRSHMARLCPGAEPLYLAILENHTLTVRRWFNVEPAEGSVVHGGVWRIGEGDVDRLDGYEDCPDLYSKEFLRVRSVESIRTRGHGDTVTRGKNSAGVSACRCVGERSNDHERQDSWIGCLVYVMKEPLEIPLTMPDPEYLELVREGYREWGIPAKQIEYALREVSGVWF